MYVVCCGFVLCGGSGRGRATPTRQAKQTATHVTHYMCSVLWFCFVWWVGSGSLETTGDNGGYSVSWPLVGPTKKGPQN